jgi:hypothetical protein
MPPPTTKLSRGLSLSRLPTTGASGGGLQVDDFNRNISMLIEADDANEKKQFQDQILDSLKLTNQRSGDITKVFNELLQLGYAGLTDTLQVFAKAVNFAVTQSDNSDDTSSDSYLSNRRALFEEEQGRDILRRIIWCSSHEDSSVSTIATAALSTLCGNLSGQIHRSPSTHHRSFSAEYYLYSFDRCGINWLGCS